MNTKQMQNPELLQLYEEWMHCKGYAESTQKNYLSLVKRFIESSQVHPYYRTTQDIVRYMAQLNASKTKESAKWALLWFYKYLFNQPKKVAVIPTPKKQKQKLTNYLTVDEWALVLSKIKNIKHRAIFQFIYSGGLRIGECVRAEVSHLDGVNYLLKILNSKGNKDRVIPLPQETFQLLRTYYTQFRPVKYLFEYGAGKQYSMTSIREILKRALASAGIQKHIRVHDIRHTRATHLIQAGAGIEFVQKFLGHSSIVTTQNTYNHSDVRDMQNAFALADQVIKNKLGSSEPVKRLKAA